MPPSGWTVQRPKVAPYIAVGRTPLDIALSSSVLPPHAWVDVLWLRVTPAEHAARRRYRNGLETIVAEVQEIKHHVSAIVESAQEQSSRLQQINTAVNQLDQDTQKNAATVEEAIAANYSLANEVRTLESSHSAKTIEFLPGDK